MTAVLLFTSPSCPACARAKMHLSTFRKFHPEIEVRVVDTTSTEEEDWQAAGIKPPEFTPSYMIISRGVDVPTQLKTFTGVLSSRQLESWLAG